MLLDFEVQRFTRRCAATDRPLAPGEECYSVLEPHGAEVIRKDYCRDAWPGPPATGLGWWKTRVPEPTQKRIKLAPNEILLELFDKLAERPGHEDMRYVLALLLVRRRVFRLETPDEALNGAARASVQDGGEWMFVYCPKREASYQVAAAMPSDERIEEIQQQLSELLLAGAE